MKTNLKIFWSGAIKPLLMDLKHVCMGGFYFFMLAFMKFLYQTRADYVLGELIIIPYTFMCVVALFYIGKGLNKSLETEKGGR
ncbi:hypothetical protein [Bacillus phage vB_BanS-Thrax4]|nr:hypothetical protein [Bacillus phage vB_BanS-Thrax4]